MQAGILILILSLGITGSAHAAESELTASDLKRSTFEDPGAEPIWTFFVAFCDEQPKAAYPAKTFQALSKLPPKLRDVCLLLRYELMWGSGGTQGAALLDNLENSTRMLRMTASAYRRFGDTQRARMMEEIIELLPTHQQKLNKADQNGTLDSFTSPLNRYDRLWEEIDFDYTEPVRNDIRAHPTEYFYPQVSATPERGG